MSVRTMVMSCADALSKSISKKIYFSEPMFRPSIRPKVSKRSRDMW